jgi:hypothetical protein
VRIDQPRELRGEELRVQVREQHEPERQRERGEQRAPRGRAGHEPRRVGPGRERRGVVDRELGETARELGLSGSERGGRHRGVREREAARDGAAGAGEPVDRGRERGRARGAGARAQARDDEHGGEQARGGEAAEASARGELLHHVEPRRPAHDGEGGRDSRRDSPREPERERAAAQAREPACEDLRGAHTRPSRRRSVQASAHSATVSASATGPSHAGTLR